VVYHGAQLTFFRDDNGDGSGVSLHHAESMHNSSSVGRESSSSGPKFKFKDDKINYKLPLDPWIIHVRWKKGGMYGPGVVPPGSTHSSSIDLRRQSIASLSSTAGSLPSQEVSSPPKATEVAPKDSVVMHMDIQLYEMERAVYLVDFKCAGYERPDGSMIEDKDVTSPFPFLDLTSDLIIQLAEQE